MAMEALAYVILHIAKSNAIDEESFAAIYESCGLDPKFKDGFFTVVAGCTSELREMLMKENERGTIHFKDMDWRLNLVTACRQR